MPKKGENLIKKALRDDEKRISIILMIKLTLVIAYINRINVILLLISATENHSSLRSPSSLLMLPFLLLNYLKSLQF